MVEDLTDRSDTTGKILNKNKADDRTFVLKPIEGKFSLKDAGTVDARLYKGGNNNLHAKRTPVGHWELHLEHGALPTGLQSTFTRFDICEKFVRDYYLKRNIEVIKVLD